MSEASISAMKRFVSGGTDLVRCSRLKFVKGASIISGLSRTDDVPTQLSNLKHLGSYLIR